jgi:MraZ protein
MSFSGEYPFALEERFRTTFPAKWRPTLDLGQVGKAREGRQLLWLTKGPTGGLWGFTPKAWDRFQKNLELRLKGVSVLNREAAMLRHLFLAPAQEVPIDRHARLLVPEALRTFAALEEEVVWVGAGPYVELYAKGRWQARDAEIARTLHSGELEAAAEKYGITLD